MRAQTSMVFRNTFERVQTNDTTGAIEILGAVAFVGSNQVRKKEGRFQGL